MSLSFASRFLHRALRPALVLVPASTAYYYHRNASSVDNRVSHSPFEWARPLFTPTISHADAAPLASSEVSQHPAGDFIPSLPSISAATVRASTGKGDSSSSPILVTFRNGVYDITSFIASHPGGDQILLAAGGPLEPYWVLYPQHANEFVLDLLEENRVANFTPDDQWVRMHHTKSSSAAKSTTSPYDNDPPRNPNLIVQSTAPYTAEPTAEAIVSSQRTPNDLFYVRNHMPVPVITESDYRLQIVDSNGVPLTTLTLDDLKTKFERVTIDATVQCAGNRRNELNRVKKVKGGGWEIGAISNAQWTGARLSDVLRYAVGEDATKGAYGGHVCFAGLDADPVTGRVYAASVPMDVLRRHDDTLLAYEMNGQTLPRDHGYPVRAVVPGVVGARHVKWLGTVTLSDAESTSHWQQQDYRSFSPDVDWNNVDFDAAPSIQEMPVISAICTHVVDKQNATVTMNGYAWSGDGKAIIRVDVSADGGKSWTGAKLLEKKTEKRNEVYDWTLWTATVKLDDGNSNAQLVCKAIDSAYNTQPDNTASIWNLRGLLNNAWHRVDVSKNA